MVFLVHGGVRVFRVIVCLLVLRSCNGYVAGCVVSCFCVSGGVGWVGV